MRQPYDRTFLLHEKGINHTTAAFQQYYPNIHSLREDAELNGDIILSASIGSDFAGELEQRLGLTTRSPLVDMQLLQQGETYSLCGVEQSNIGSHLFRQHLPHTTDAVSKLQLRDESGPVTVTFELYEGDLVLARMQSPHRHKILTTKPLGLEVTHHTAYKNEFPVKTL